MALVLSNKRWQRSNVAPKEIALELLAVDRVFSHIAPVNLKRDNELEATIVEKFAALAPVLDERSCRAGGRRPNRWPLATVATRWSRRPRVWRGRRFVRDTSENRSGRVPDGTHPGSSAEPLGLPAAIGSQAAGRRYAPGPQRADRSRQRDSGRASGRWRAGDLGRHEEEGTGGQLRQPGLGMAAEGAAAGGACTTIRPTRRARRFPRRLRYGAQRSVGECRSRPRHNARCRGLDSRLVAKMGRRAYPNATTLYITADAGGSNEYRSRAWKHELHTTLCRPDPSDQHRLQHLLCSVRNAGAD